MIIFLYICIWIVGGNCPMKAETRTPFPDTFVRGNLKRGIMKTINLTKGFVALVDDEDFNYLNQWKWFAKNNKGYKHAIRIDYTLKGARKNIRMARLILSIPKGQRIKYLDGNELNYQKHNMLVFSPEENKEKYIEKRKELKCSVCGSNIRVFFSSVYGDFLCGNHRNHINRNGNILSRTRSTPNPIVLKDDYAEIIIFDINQNEKGRALIDIEDVDLVKEYKWSIDGNGAVANGSVGKLHRFVLKAKDANKEVDHWNRNPLDCRKYNLREITHSLNIHNSKMWKHNTSGVTGVYWLKKRKKWKVIIYINCKAIFLGHYTDINDAAIARKNAEERLLPIKIYPR